MLRNKAIFHVDFHADSHDNAWYTQMNAKKEALTWQTLNNEWFYEV